MLPASWGRRRPGRRRSRRTAVAGGGILTAVREMRRTLVENPLVSTDGGYSVDLDGLRDLIDERTRIVLLYGNPLTPVLGVLGEQVEVAGPVGGARDLGPDGQDAVDAVLGPDGDQDLHAQRVAGALDDVMKALAFDPPHVSHYQLTLEPNTLFHARPPVLPDEETAWAMQEACGGLLSGSGLVQYEVSAWSKAEGECLHNLNYWRYGDFVGIGAGAHGKLTLPLEGAVRRRVRLRHPRDWMAAAKAGEAVAEDAVVPAADRAFEFFLNQLRLRAGVLKFQFTPRTGLPWSAVESPVDEAISKGLLEDRGDRLVATDLGWRFVNEIQALFLPV